MTRLAQLIAQQEGFFTSGSLPARNHNPGDLRHSPNSQHPGDPNAIGVIDNDADGWEDLERQLRIDASRGMKLGEAIYSWAPPIENDSAVYLRVVIEGFGGRFDANTPLSEVLEVGA